MTWTCDQIEARLSDYIDGVLEGAERGEFAAHAESCAHCAPLFASVRSLVREMHAIEELEVPPRLVYAILDQTLGPREKVSSWQVFLSLIRGMATPKFAYGAASIFATLVILVSSMGFSTRNPKMADLRPAAIYRNADAKMHGVLERAVAIAQQDIVGRHKVDTVVVVEVSDGEGIGIGTGRIIERSPKRAVAVAQQDGHRAESYIRCGDIQSAVAVEVRHGDRIGG